MEFARYLLRPELWTEIPPPWPEIFGRFAPLAVEIGFGNGEFLAEMAQRHPDWNWVGFETSLTCLVKTGRKLALGLVGNVRLALLDGKFGLSELFPEGSLARVHVHFPCPWPKSRYAERRLVEESFARALAAALAPHGEFHLVTDALWYAEEAKAHLVSAGLTVEGPEVLTDTGPGTRYERKWRSRGLSIWKLVAKAQTPGKVKRLSEGPMPHAKIAVPFSPERIKALSGLKETWPEGAFVVKEVFFSPTEEVALLRVFANDQGFAQHFFLVVSAYREGVMVQLDSASVPFRTPAVKRAVAAAAKALEAP